MCKADIAKYNPFEVISESSAIIYITNQKEL